MQWKLSKRKPPEIVPSFWYSDDLVLREFSKQQISQVRQKYEPASAYFLKDGRIKELMMFLFRDRMVAVNPVSDGNLLHLVLQSNQIKAESLSVNMTTPTILDVIIFLDCFSFFNDRLMKKTLTLSQNLRAGTLGYSRGQGFLRA